MRQSLTRLLPYRPEQVFDLVADVEAYPAFLPWIATLATRNHRQDGEGVSSLDADAAVKFAILTERFSTHVQLDRPRLAIDVGLLRGPFRRLENRWRFRPHARGTELSFEIDFEFRSRLLDGLLAANSERAIRALVRCFEGRAAQLYGGRR